jgi:hypothetical protein
VFEAAGELKAVGVGINIFRHASRELRALSASYKRVAGYDKERLKARG